MNTREKCMLAGIKITPEMISRCNQCELYLEVCLPSLDESGYIVGAECDESYCEYCSSASLCSV